jgi:hypothetical protein
MAATRSARSISARGPKRWGIRPDDQAHEFPCDRFVEPSADTYWRAVGVDAPSGAVFRWLCQLRVAPYSYDLVDNFGRRSPRELIDGLEHLERGQRFMRLFELVDLDDGEQITLDLKASRLRMAFGHVAVTYRVVPEGASKCRLVAKVRVEYPYGLAGLWQRNTLPLADLVMMRRQLTNLKSLSER